MSFIPIKYDFMFQVDINISQVEDGKTIPVLRLVVMSLGTEVTIHTFDMDVAAYLGGVYVQHRKFLGKWVMFLIFSSIYVDI